MSFDKIYPNRKDRRKQYRRGGKYDKRCRPGGACEYCQQNRQYSNTKRRLIADEQILNWKQGEYDYEI